MDQRDAWPSDEIRESIRRVVQEARHELSQDRWVLLPNERTVPFAHAAAGLAHCCALAEEIVAAHERGAEFIGRILARALFETWLVAYYIHHGGMEALEAVAAAYHHAIATQHRLLKNHDDQVRRRRRDVRRRNRKIEATNRGIEEWNRRNPTGAPKPPLPLLEEPPGVIVGWDDHAWLRTMPRVPPGPLPLTEIIDRLRRLTKAAGQEEVFDAAYHLAYRGLSSLGAHASLFVLNANLDDRAGTGIFLRIRSHPTVPSSFEDSNLAMAALLLSGLSVAALEDQGSECPQAHAVLDEVRRAMTPG